MFINYQNNHLFIHIPKTAGTSITSCYTDNYETYSEENKKGQTLVNKVSQDRFIHTHESIKTFKDLIDLNQFESFAVVRNPFDLLVSHYHFAKTRENINYKGSFEEFLHEMLVSHLDFNYYSPYDAKKTMISYLTDSNGDFLVKRILKFENIEEEFYSFTGLSLKNYKINDTEHDNYRLYYNEKTKKLVENYFESDLSHFNYKF